MFHKNVSSSAASATSSTNDPTFPQNPAGLSLVRASTRTESFAPKPSPLIDLAIISSRRCSSFFAEAAVLVLVFGILDFFMLKGRIELPWILGALTISLFLLGTSIAMDFSAQRWSRAHP